MINGYPHSANKAAKSNGANKNDSEIENGENPLLSSKNISMYLAIQLKKVGYSHQQINQKIPVFSSPDSIELCRRKI